MNEVRVVTTRGWQRSWGASPLVQCMLGGRVVALVAVLALCGCGGGGADGGVLASGSNVNVNQDPSETSVEVPIESRTVQASEPGDLLAYAKTKLAQRQQLRVQAASNNVSFSTTGDTASSNGPVFSAGGTAAPVIERSATVVQEDGVDEDDFIKSDGSTIFTLGKTPGSAVLGVRRVVSNGSTTPVAQVKLTTPTEPYTDYTGMYLAAQFFRVAVLGSVQRWEQLNFCEPALSCPSASLWPFPYVNHSTVALDVVNTANVAQGVSIDKLRIDGNLVGSRLIGSSLVLVTQFTPRLAVDALPWNAAQAEREAAMNRLTARDLLPTISVNGSAASPLVEETDCFIEPKNASFGLDVTSITVIDLSSPTLQRSSRCFIGGSEALYMSTSALYLATTQYTATPLVTASGTRVFYPPQISTDIHKFALLKGQGGGVVSVDFRGSGSVIGHLGWSTQQRSYRMSEYDGHLRVLTFTGQSGWGVLTDASSATAPAPSPATLTVLREATTGKSLQAVGRLPNKERPQPIGKPGEQVYAVRFIGDRAYVVTFRQVDPLYIIDLSKTNDPKTTGELTIAGFSDYLFPVGPTGSGLLLGVGKDADERGVTTGVKVALFDVADPAQPRQRSTVTIGGSGSRSALDSTRHGIDLFTRGNQTRVVLPVTSVQYVPASGGSAYAYLSALQRFEVDATTRSMKLITPLAQTATYRSVGQERTLQMGDVVHHFMPGADGSTFVSYPW